MRKTTEWTLRRLRAEWPLILAFLVGAALRLDQIRSQIPLDDEWHTLHAVVRSSFYWLLTNFAWTYYSIPWAVYHRVVADTIGLSEIGLRAPALLCGLASLIVFPVLARPWTGRSASHIFALLMALSPMHVYFSRFARPYSVALLLAFTSITAFYTWWRGGTRRWVAIYVLCAALGPFFHLSVLAAVLAPIPFGLAACFVNRRQSDNRRSLADLVRLMLAVCAVFGALFGPPLVISGSWLVRKSGLGVLTLETLAGATELLLGTGNPALLVAAILLACTGGLWLFREQRSLVAYLATISVASVAVPFVSRPLLVEMPIVFARYCLIIVPIGLMLISLALARISARAGRLRSCATVALSAAFCLAYYHWGPLPSIYYHPNNWTNHGLFQYDYSPHHSDWRCPQSIPRFYYDLARAPRDSALIVEAPWWFGWHSNVYPCYQRVHRQPMIIGFVGTADPDRPASLPRPGELPRCDLNGRFRFNTFVHVGDHADLRRRRVRYVVFHHAIEREVAAGNPAYRVKIAKWIREYRALYGKPVYRDDLLVVFDVGQAR
jgi:mannosyltransferase